MMDTSSQKTALNNWRNTSNHSTKKAPAEAGGVCALRGLCGSLAFYFFEPGSATVNWQLAN